ncbi:MAG: hypothetical protein JRH20_10000 [Deltaproteobacteria bacterium]|nr:hypothetical protein [Deltaproteobacteria bacterium]
MRCWFFITLTSACALLSLMPLADHLVARWQVSQLLQRATKNAHVAPSRRSCDATRLERPDPIATAPRASWGDIGGCGAGGAGGSTAGGVRWIGRSVTGGLIDVQCLSSATQSHGGTFTAFSTRLATGAVFQKWVFALNIPLLYKTGEVNVLGATKRAHIAGFGDMSVEVTRKLGIANASVLTLSASGPAGASEAVRQGVVLPQSLQMGSGVLSFSGVFQHTLDRDWGLIVLGANGTYAGWENSIGDFRGSSGGAFGYAGYIWGPFVPSVGLGLTGQFEHSRERGRPLDDPLFIASPQLAIEWASDTLALLLASTVSVSYKGLESVNVTLGVSASLF